MAELIALGIVKMLKDVTMGNPQPSPKGFKPMDAVQRLDGSGCSIYLLCLRYSLLSCESMSIEKLLR